MSVRHFASALGVLFLGGIVAGCASSDPDPSLYVDAEVLEPDVRVYDETGDSLTADETEDLGTRLTDLGDIDADAIVYVRSLDVDSDATLDQVEALQQSWVAATGADQDDAIAILINRNPDDPTDARAGIFVGSTFDDGKVPRDEQRGIVNNEIIPPLRDADVYAGLVAGIERLNDSIVNGPPTNAFEEFADDAGSAWYPWAGVGVAAVLGILSVLVFGRRATTDRADMAPTTVRPSGGLTPGLAGGLAGGGPQASVVPATLLDLAAPSNPRAKATRSRSRRSRSTSSTARCSATTSKRPSGASWRSVPTAAWCRARNSASSCSSPSRCARSSIRK